MAIYGLLKVVIFHGHGSLPEGIWYVQESKIDRKMDR